MHILDRIELGGIVTVRDSLIELQSRGRKIYRLESGDPSFSVPPHVAAAIEKAIRDGHTHYTAGAGIQLLRDAIAKKLVEQNRIPVAGPASVLVTNGAMNALYVAFRSLCEPGDEVIVPDPTWTETADNVALAGGVPVRAPLDASSGCRYSAEAIAARVTPRTRAIVVNSPHNPTGVVCSREELLAIVEVASKHGLWVLSDEAYEHVIFDGREHVSPGSLGYDRVISVFSMSKSYAMSGLRVGYVAVDDALLLERMAKLLRCTINGVSSVTQWGALAALTGPQAATGEMCAEYQLRRDLLFAALQGATAVRASRPEGAFYLWCRIDPRWEGGSDGRRDGWAMTRWLLHEAGIGSAPGEVFGPFGAGHVRFAFSCATPQVREAAGILGELLG